MDRLRKVGYNLVDRRNGPNGPINGTLNGSATSASVESPSGVVPALWISSEEIRCVSPALPPSTLFVADLDGSGAPLPPSLPLEISLNRKVSIHGMGAHHGHHATAITYKPDRTESHRISPSLSSLTLTRHQPTTPTLTQPHMHTYPAGLHHRRATLPVPRPSHAARRQPELRIHRRRHAGHGARYRLPKLADNLVPFRV